MKFIDLFAGIGGFRFGMEAAGHECVAFCEIDKFARASYKTIFSTEGEVEWHDITTVSNEEFRKFRGQVDVICGGFPCQAFSVAGRRLGFEDTRGTLFFEIARVTKEIQPQLLFLENVRGLLNHNKGETFRTILSTLDELGYDVEWQLLNSKDFGVAQNRERVFIIGHSRRGRSRRVFPIQGKIGEPNLERVGNVNPSNNGASGEVYLSTGLAPTLVRGKGEGQKIAIPVLTPDRTTKRQNGRRLKTDGEPMFTLTSQDRHGVVVSKNKVHRAVTSNFRIRKLTPRECWRLQGFPDWVFDKAQEVNSKSQLYKQAGNSVTVNVIEAIAKRFETE